MAFTYRDAELSNATVFIGLAGPSGSGKTFSALRVATGLARGKPVYFIDTEARRGLHYANQFKFKHGELSAPFSPSHYLEAIHAAKAAGAGVLVVDSMSHEHEGDGGVLDMHETELDRMAGNDYAKRERVKFAAWIKPKRDRNKLVNAILQLGMHCVFCFRAKEKIALVKDNNGKQQPVALGFQPIVGDRFEYEMTALLMLPPNSRGVPDLALSKTQDQFAPFFKPGAQIDEMLGQRFATWADGKAAPTATGTKTAPTGLTGPASAKNPPPSAAADWPLVVPGGPAKRFDTGKKWLAAIHAAIVDAKPVDRVGIWDSNSDTYHAIAATAKDAGNDAAAAVIAKAGAAIQQILAASAPGADGGTK